MQKYQDFVYAGGQPVVGATVTVTNYPAGTPATIYSDNSGTVASNPQITDGTGFFSFYAADGRYTLTINKTGYVSRVVSDVLLEDPADGSALTVSLLTVTGVGNFADIISTGAGVTTGDAAIEVGAQRTGNGPAYLDLHGGVSTDFEARFIRLGGADGAASLINTGLGALNIQQGGAAPIVFQTSNTERGRFRSTGGLDVISDVGAIGLFLRGRASDDLYGALGFYNNAGTSEWARIQGEASGTGLLFSTGGSATPQMRVTHTASSQRTVNVTGALVTQNPKISASGGALEIASAVEFSGQTTGTTVGVAGGASALPATPLGYLTTKINGTAVRIPYYN